MASVEPFGDDGHAGVALREGNHGESLLPLQPERLALEPPRVEGDPLHAESLAERPDRVGYAEHRLVTFVDVARA
jgi:hypothetical protein